MSTPAEKQLALLTAKGVARAQALSAAGGNVEDAEYLKQMKTIEKIFKQGLKALRKEKPPKELTEHAQALEDLDLLNQQYVKVCQFQSLDEAQTALRALATDWVTGKSGRHGGNKLRQHHGGPRGCFMITCNKTTLVAELWQAESNEDDLPDDMPGATEIEEEEEEAEEEDYLPAVALLVASAGKSIQEITAMDKAGTDAHAVKCNADRSITARAVQDLAEKMGCPSVQKTKLQRLTWILFDCVVHA